MANVLDRNFDFATNGTVTAAGLHNLIDDTNIYAGLISTQEERTSVGTADLLLIANSSSIGSPQIAANRTTVYNLFEDALTGGTYANAQLSGNLTYGTATGGRTISTGANITNGTISTLIAGTTTSTAATITSGTIATLNSTTGTIATLNSTTGTITNLSTTLAGDFTISQGTGTLGTSGATLGTYGGATSIPVLAIDAKGRITTASTSAITSGLTGFRNRIINGDMRIDQRNAGASVTDPTNSYTLDRFASSQSQASKYSVQQNAGAVTPPSGFTNYLGVTSLSAYTVGSSENFAIYQPIEGFNVSDLDWGKATAKTVTLSFWVRSSLTGTFGVSLMNSAQNRSYPASYTINTAGAWEYKTISISGDTSGTWLTTNGVGIYLFIGLGVGSAFSGASGSWAGTGYFGVTGATSVVGTNGATLYITGVQLEQGSTATEFERRPIGTELALCQRYFWKSFDQSVAPAQNVATGGNLQSFGPASNVSFTAFQQLPSTMRAIPSVTSYSPDNASSNWTDQGGARPTASVQNIGQNGFGVRATGSVLAGGSYAINLIASAEL